MTYVHASATASSAVLMILYDHPKKLSVNGLCLARPPQMESHASLAIPPSTVRGGGDGFGLGTSLKTPRATVPLSLTDANGEDAALSSALKV